MRLIDADKFEIVYSKTERTDEAYVTGYIDGMQDALEMVDTALTIDAIPVVHGYNESGCSSVFVCSLCGWECYDTFCSDGPFFYCPNCGAKMDASAEERTKDND